MLAVLGRRGVLSLRESLVITAERDDFGRKYKVKRALAPLAEFFDNVAVDGMSMLCDVSNRFQGLVAREMAWVRCGYWWGRRKVRLF